MGAAAGEHTLLLTDLGQVLSFGYNALGQLGLGDTNTRHTPCLVEELVGTFVVQVTAGNASSGAVSATGKSFTWGIGDGYGLGHGTTDHQHTPKRVEALTKYTITQLALGWRHGMVLDDKGNVYSWGLGGWGQLGHGNNENQQLPKQIEYLKENKYKVKKIHCNFRQSVVLLEKGEKVLTFGEGGYGRLGHGDHENQSTPTVISSLEGTKISEVHVGEDHLLLLSESADGGGKIFSCGPPMMMESVRNYSLQNNLKCDLALETIMACGFGICQGCTVEKKAATTDKHSYRNKFVLACMDGPIFNAEGIVSCM